MKVDLNHIARECIQILEPLLWIKPLDIQEVNHTTNFTNVESFFVSFAEKDVLTTKNLNNQLLLPACYQLAGGLNKIKYYSFVAVPISAEIKQWSVLAHKSIRISVRKEYSIERKQEEIILQIWVIKR